MSDYRGEMKDPNNEPAAEMCSSLRSDGSAVTRRDETGLSEVDNGWLVRRPVEENFPRAEPDPMRPAFRTPVDYDPNDPVDRRYYDAPNGLKVIDVIEAFGLTFTLGNVVKYVLRAGRKTSDVVKDLEKARWNLDREIARAKRKASE